MDRKKIEAVVKGYLLKDKRKTALTSLFLCFVVALLLIGNQLFENVSLTNRLNAEALEGKQHVTYYDISKEDLMKIKRCPFVESAGQSVSLGQAGDGTTFAYIDEEFRSLSATVADKNVKRVISGHWAKKENEVVVTENYTEKYDLKAGNQIHVDLTVTDADTGERLYKMRGITFTIAGIIENSNGFTDRSMGYVSEKFLHSVVGKKQGNTNVAVKFNQETNIVENIEKLNAYLGCDEANTVIRKNGMLAEAVDESGSLKRQSQMMNFIIWLVCVLVTYHIFYNRFFEKKKDFINMRKVGFQSRDLIKITAIEFAVLALMGIAAGILTGALINKAIYSEMMKMMTDRFDAVNLVSSDLSWSSVRNTLIMLILVFIPSAATVILQLRNISPVNLMKKQRKHTRKIVITLMIVSLSGILISLLGIQDNHSDNGIAYVKTYVTGDLQVGVGSISTDLLEDNAPFISNKALAAIKEDGDIERVQDYAVNYDEGVFLCEEKSRLNKDAAGYYEMLSQMEQRIDGKKKCLYNMTLATTGNMKALSPSYSKEKKKHVAMMEEGMAKTLNLRKGDSFTLYGEEIVQTGATKGAGKVTVELLDTRKDMVLSESHLGPNLMIVDEDTAKLIPGTFSRQIINIWVKDGKEAAVLARLKQIPELDGCILRSAKEQMKEYVDADLNQTVMHCFFIILLAFTGGLTYFNTAFTNIMSRIHDFTIMHKIGFGRVEMCRLMIKEEMKNGIMALAIIGTGQIVLSVTNHIAFGKLFLAIDAGVIAASILFPAAISLRISLQALKRPDTSSTPSRSRR